MRILHISFMEPNSTTGGSMAVKRNSISLEAIFGKENVTFRKVEMIQSALSLYIFILVRIKILMVTKKQQSNEKEILPLIDCYNTIIRLAKKYNIPIINHYNDPDYIWRRDIFQEPIHLNDKGAMDYSKEVASELGNLLKDA